MNKNPLEPRDKGKWHGNVKVTTSSGKNVSHFTMQCWFYNTHVDRDTGEVKQARYTYVGYRYQRELMKGKINCDTELDALLYTLHQVQDNVQKAIIYNNFLPGTTDAIIFEVKEGRINPERNKLKDYEIMVRKLIPNYRIIPHDAKDKAA